MLGDEEMEAEVAGSRVERAGDGRGDGYRCRKHPVELCVCLCQHQAAR